MQNIQLIKTNYLELQKSMDVLIDNYNKGNFLPHKIGSTRRFLFSGYINLIKSAYSLNEPISIIKLYLNESIDLVELSFNEEIKYEYNNKVLNQFIFSYYEELLWILSLTISLKLPDEKINKIANVIKTNIIGDKIYNALLQTKPDLKEFEIEESYTEIKFIPQSFKSLREAIEEGNKSKKVELIKFYLLNEWYNIHKDSGWYDIHKSKSGNGFYGYWAFETAALVSIFDLDDTELINLNYYPANLVAYFKTNN